MNGTRAGDRKEPWFAHNLIEEITRPSNRCVDAAKRTLYFWPPEDATPNDSVLLADGTQATLRITGAKHVAIENLVLAGSLDAAVAITEGAENVALRGCTMRSTGGVGARVTGSSSIEII